MSQERNQQRENWPRPVRARGLKLQENYIIKKGAELYETNG
jgi:hypothetical protein